MSGTLILFGLIVILAISSVLLRPLMSGPIRCILAGLSGFVLATLVRYRAFPFLQHDAILSGGKLYPTAQWAPATAKFLYVGSAIFLLIGMVSLFIGLVWTHRFAKADSAGTPKT
jgi:hypothetical protein